MSFFVSVIIPVYNAARFITEAVESALAQPETAEVILIEDGSPDDSLSVCQALADKYGEVRLFQHPDRENCGAAASRNLGMKHAQYDYIAFLDADDYYLPGRFEVANEIFESDPECDGVYEAIGIHFEDESAKKSWLSSPMGNVEMTTMSKIVHPNELFERLVKVDAGYFSLDGLIIKKSLLLKSLWFNPSLLMHEDTEFIYKLAAVGKLLPGRLEEPVTVRRVHGNNRIVAKRSRWQKYQDIIKMWKSTYNWLDKSSLYFKKILILEKMIHECRKSKPLPFIWMTKLPEEFAQLIRLFLFIFEYPAILLKKYYWRSIFSIQIWPVFKRNIKKILP